MIPYTPNVGDTFDYFFKIVLVGDAGVGKTSIMHRYIKGTFPDRLMPTIGVEYATRILRLTAGISIKAQLWDTAGHERYRAMTCAHYRKAVGALLVYDVTNLKSFQNARKWVNELKALAEPDIIILLVGNKIDLCSTSLPNIENQENGDQGHRVVSQSEAKGYAAANEILFMETSALQSLNIQNAFHTLIQTIYKEKFEGKGKTTEFQMKISSGKENKKKSSYGCCKC